MESAIQSRSVSVFETNEPERAIGFVSGLYGPHALQLATGRDLHMRVQGVGFAGLHLGELRYGTPVTGRMRETQPYWVFGYLRAGSLRRGSDGATFGAGDAGVIPPDVVQQLQISADAELVNLRVDEQDLKDACGSLLGSALAEPLRFADSMRAGTAQAAMLVRTIERLASTPVYTHQRAARFEACVRDAVLHEFLLAWPNNYARWLDQPIALPATTRRARDYIHAHAADTPSVAEIARACGVGVRALARGFEKHLQTSPLAYMLGYRLEKSREELLAAPDSATVTDIAFKWGFMQLGSFAARYRHRFGETPSETLRRRHH
jgi:AraC-like DNA-binding protein